MNEHKSWNEKTPEERTEAAEKLKACNDRMRARLTEVLSIAEKVLVKTVHPDGHQPGQYGQDYRDLGKAIAEIRTICKKDLSGDFPDYEWMAGMMTSEHFDPNRLAQEIEAKASEKLGRTAAVSAADPASASSRDGCGTEELAVSGCPSLGPKVFPSGADGTEPAPVGYEKFMTLPNGCRLVRFHGSEKIRLLSSRRGTSGHPNNVFEICVDKSGKKAYVSRDDMPLFTIEGRSVGFNIVEKLAVSALKRYLKDRMTDNARHNRRRAAKRAAANKALIEKELA